MTVGTTGRRASRPARLGVLVVLIVVIAVAGWLLITRVLMRHSLDARADADGSGADAVSISADNASLTIQPSADGAVHVAVTGRYSGPVPRVAATRTGNSMQIDVLCGDHWFAHCALDASIQLPAEVAVTVRDDNGHVDVQQINGDLDLRTDNGDVEVDSASGALTAVTDNGAITVGTSSSPQLRLTTDNGDVSVEVESDPSNIDVRTDNGDVEIEVEGDESYVVDTSTDSGHVTTGVRTDPASSHRITVTTDNGDISIRPRG